MYGGARDFAAKLWSTPVFTSDGDMMDAIAAAKPRRIAALASLQASAVDSQARLAAHLSGSDHPTEVIGVFCAGAAAAAAAGGVRWPQAGRGPMVKSNSATPSTPACDVITWLQRHDAGGGSAVDEVAGGEGDRLRDGADDFWDGPDQVLQVAVLFDDARRRRPRPPHMPRD